MSHIVLAQKVKKIFGEQYDGSSEGYMFVNKTLNTVMQ
jgi:hypothetical protein